MVRERKKDWRELCRVASVEQDPNKLMDLVDRVIAILESEERRKALPIPIPQMDVADL
jgi:hypothetical protein